MAVGDSFLVDFSSTVSTIGTGQVAVSTIAKTVKSSSVAVDANIVFSVISADDSGRLFKMQMSKVVISTVDDKSVKTPVADQGDLDKAFENDFFFKILANGAIDYVASKENDTDVESVKKGIVSTLQTRLDQKSGAVVSEVDAIGSHKSKVVVSTPTIGARVYEKHFTENDFSAFPDVSVTPSSFKVTGYGRVKVLPDGRFLEAYSKVTVRAFTKNTPTKKTRDSSQEPFTNELFGDGENLLANWRPSNAKVETFVSIKEFHTLNPELETQPLVVSVPTGWVIGHDDDELKKSSVHLAATADDSDYPYNRSVSADKMLGGDTVGVSFDAQLFAGTNFDCNHNVFNYKLLAEADASVHLFGHTHGLFDAKFEYGRDNGAALSDAASVTFWEKSVFSKSFSELSDCQEHVQSITQTDPGFSAQHTIHISIVPITFAASADADLKLSWGYELCDAQLLAFAEVIPSVTVRVAGSADLSVIIAKAGVSLSGSVIADVRPQLYLNGSRCVTGFDVLLDAEPLTVGLAGYYQTRSCHWFKCTWGDRHDKQFWSYSAPKHTNEQLYQKEFDIKSLIPHTN